MRQPRRQTTKAAHGSEARYDYGCRCMPCRVANAQRCARYYARKKIARVEVAA